MQLEFVENTPLDLVNRAIEQSAAGNKISSAFEIAGLYYLFVDKAEEVVVEDKAEEVKPAARQQRKGK